MCVEHLCLQKPFRAILFRLVLEFSVPFRIAGRIFSHVHFGKSPPYQYTSLDHQVGWLVLSPSMSKDVHGGISLPHVTVALLVPRRTTRD